MYLYASPVGGSVPGLKQQLRQTIMKISNTAFIALMIQGGTFSESNLDTYAAFMSQAELNETLIDCFCEDLIYESDMPADITALQLTICVAWLRVEFRNRTSTERIAEMKQVEQLAVGDNYVH